MLYSQILQNEKISAALKDAGVDHVPSPLMKDGDFSKPIETLDNRLINLIIDGEILSRRSYINMQNKVAELELKFAPEIKIQEKANFIRPHIEALIQGNLKEPYDTTEVGCIAVLSEYCAKNFDFEPGESESKQEDYSGLSELQKLLKQSGVTQLSNKMSIEEIALRGLNESPILKFMK